MVFGMGLKETIFRHKKLIAVLVGFALFLYSFSLVDLEKFLKVISGANLLILLLAYPISLVSISLKSMKFRKLINALGHDYGLRDLMEIFTIGFFFGVLTPGRMGDFSRAVYIKDKVPLSRGGVAVFLDRAIDVFVLLTFAFISILVFFLFFHKIIFPLELVLLMILGLVVLMYVFLNMKKFEPISRFFYRFAPQNLKATIGDSYRKINEATAIAKGAPGKLIIALLIGFASWTVNFMIGFAILAAFSIDVPVYFIFLLMPIISLIDVVPVSIGGLGTRDVASIFIFSLIGIGAEQAVAFSVTFFLILYPILSFLGFVFSVKRKMALPWGGKQ